MFHFEVVADWIDTLLMSNMPQWLALAIEFVLIGILILSLYAVLALILILAETLLKVRIGEAQSADKISQVLSLS